MKKYFTHILLIILFASLFILRCARKSETIATVGPLNVSRNEMLKLIRNKFPAQHDFKNIELTEKKEILDDLILKKLKVNEALELGYDKDQNFRKRYNENGENLILFRYFEEFVVNKFISEDEVNEIMNKRNIELKASHILVGFNEASKKFDRPKEAAKHLAQFIANEAKSGADFNDLVKKYSDDPKTNDKNGDLGYFRWGKMAESFQEAVWKMKVGEISDPVETKFGFHIIRLDDRREIPSLGSEQKIYYQIKQNLYSQRLAKARKIADSLHNALHSKYSFQIKNDAIKDLAELIKNKIAKDSKITEKNLSEEEKMTILAEWENEKITLDSLIKSFGYQSSIILSDFKNPTTLEDYILRLSNTKLMLKDALESGLERDKYVVEEQEKYFQNRLVQIYDDKQIRKKIKKIEDAEIEDYYKNNPEEFKSKDGQIPPLEKVKVKIGAKIRKIKTDELIAEQKKVLYEKYPVKINEKDLSDL
jgi:parvulin-like peptidyl-prolyl isomerase